MPNDLKCMLYSKPNLSCLGFKFKYTPVRQKMNFISAELQLQCPAKKTNKQNTYHDFQYWHIDILMWRFCVYNPIRIVYVIKDSNRYLKELVSFFYDFKYICKNIFENFFKIYDNKNWKVRVFNTADQYNPKTKQFQFTGKHKTIFETTGRPECGIVKGKVTGMLLFFFNDFVIRY